MTSTPPQADMPPETPEMDVPEAAETDKYQELNNQFIRLQADFDNFRKRVETEKLDLLKYGATRTLEALLPVIDNLHRGTVSLNEGSDPKLLYQSFNLVSKELLDSLSAQGLKKMDVVGLAFDPFYHEAVSRAASPDHAENVIMQEVKAGYLLHDRVLRPALVIVSDGSTVAPAENADNPFQAETAG